MTNNLRRLGDKISVPISAGDDGFTGRECPDVDCEGFFKLEFGTGLKGSGLPCHCPYCGHIGPHDEFWTKEQIEYAKSVALNKITGALIQDLKKSEVDIKPSGPFGIGFSIKVTGKPTPIRYYREEALETEIVCDKCTLHYAVFGVFAFCPDCGAHNSRQILAKNFELAEKQVALATTVDKALSDHLLADALENAVSSFDGFGREVARRFAGKSANPSKAEALSFQNLTGARKNCTALFGFDFAATVSEADWAIISRAFQKRHLFAHSMGVVDAQYLQTARDPSAVLGRKVQVAPDEVRQVLALLTVLGERLFTGMETAP